MSKFESGKNWESKTFETSHSAQVTCMLDDATVTLTTKDGSSVIIDNETFKQIARMFDKRYKKEIKYSCKVGRKEEQLELTEEEIKKWVNDGKHVLFMFGVMYKRDGKYWVEGNEVDIMQDFKTFGTAFNKAKKTIIPSC
jgi:hypothetical protein